jgi:hypothetical protein
MWCVSHLLAAALLLSFHFVVLSVEIFHVSHCFYPWLFGGSFFFLIKLLLNSVHLGNMQNS